MNKLPSIDLVVCTYNNAELLQQTLHAMAQLEVPPGLDWGVLVVNNQCTDNTADMVQKFMQEQVIPLQTIIEPEQGLVKARLCGVRHTGREWIGFIDDDALVDKTYLQAAIRFIQQHPDCGMFGSRIQLQFLQSPPGYVHRFPFAYAGKNHGRQPKRMAAIAGLGMMARRAALEASGWTQNQLLPDRIGKRLTSGGDMEMSLRVGARFELWYQPDCLLYHQIPEHRTTPAYLQRMLFGLGVCRHDVQALTWKKSYRAWLWFSVLQAFGFGLMGVGALIGEWKQPVRGAGFKVAFSTLLGWCAGMIRMWRYGPKVRQRLLGAVHS